MSTTTNGNPQSPKQNGPGGQVMLQEQTHVDGMYENWFLDYASYVILERAVPALVDGLKPVQRRILHAMRTTDDGRYHKVANIIGNTMQYHPHGDAAIGEALVNMGQKELLIDTQGNWGDIRTGDSAAAPRYIEARLSKFALEVLFNAAVTEWQLSYDGRKKEPVTLPVKFPLVLAQGVEGIAVGLATKIMPHNFNELIDASINYLRGQKFTLVPDFPTGGMADFSNYNDGLRGGRIRVRAKIEVVDRKQLVIRDIPFGTTTTNLMESIVKANDNNKIKIKRVTDNTAKDVEIVVELPPGVSPDVTIDALYAFTDCEVSISPNACVIIDDKPQFLGASEILRRSTDNTVQVLKRELEITLEELFEKWHFASLEKIFIENRIYRDIEECETWESVIETIDRGLEPFKKLLKREVTVDDIVRLTEIKIKRISKYNSFKADEEIRGLEGQIKETEYNLAHLVEYAIGYFSSLKERYGKGRERRTEIRTFDTIQAAQVAVASEKLYVNRKDGFIGYGMKKDEYVCDCSDIDDIIVFRSDGKYLVTRVSEKAFVGKNIIHAGVWNKNNEHMVYNAIYFDGKSGVSYAKRFAVTAITRDKEYDVSKGSDGSKLLYFTANQNSEAEVVTIYLSQRSKARKKVFDFDFAELAIKGRGSQGNILSKYPVARIVQKTAGKSTLGGRDIWFDNLVGRLNTEERGLSLGSFEAGDLILAVYKNGTCELTDFELTNRYDPELVASIEKFDPEVVITAVYYEGSAKKHYVKRFQLDSPRAGKKYPFIGEHRSSKLDFVSTAPVPFIVLDYAKGRSKEQFSDLINLAEFMDMKGWKALGNQLTRFEVLAVKPIDIKVGQEGESENGKLKK